MELQARTPRHEAKEHAWHLAFMEMCNLMMMLWFLPARRAAALARARALLCLTESLQV